MINRWAFEAFDRTLSNVMTSVVDGAKDLPFGGKTIVFGGDFCQILSVVPRGGRADIVYATISSSPLWCVWKVLKLTRNMRLQFSGDADKNQSLRLFAKWILDIGDGKFGIDDDGEAVVDILDDICIQTYGNHIGYIVDSTYPYLLDNMNNSSFLKDRAILTPTLDLVENVNDYVMSLI